jgi:Gram-negative bacterial TonB protein C-terminal
MSQRNERSTPPELDAVTHWLIHHAARRAPESLSSRLEEEWLADLGSRSSALSRLRLAVGCCWATLVIVNDCPRTRVPAASPAAAARGFIALTDRSFGYFSLRSGTLFLIAGLHAALFFGLITTLSHTRGTPSTPILENQTLEDVPRKKEPVLQSLTRDWTISVPKPDLEVPPLRVPSEDAATEVVNEPTEPYLPPSTPAVPTLVARVAGGPGAGFPDTADFYPSLSIHLEEQGISTVRVCVDNHGRLTSDPTTVHGSGSARLDDGALKLARAGSGHYRATTEDGQPVNSCYPIGIRFQLKK